MALFRLACKACKNKRQVLAESYPKIKTEQLVCRACGGGMGHEATGPSAQVMERLDNGAMPRAVERLADAERLYQERADAADPLAGGAQRPDRTND